MPSRVLVVEDDNVLLKLLGHVLARAGFEVAMARNGQVALDILADGFHADVVLLDLLMPLMDGRAFISAVAGGPLASIPIVVLSASLNRENVRGVAASLVKPTFPAEVIAELQRVVALSDGGVSVSSLLAEATFELAPQE